MNNLYSQVADSTGPKPTKQLFYSIRVYLEEYKNTSKSKDVRIKALSNANTLTEYVVNDVIVHATDSIGDQVFAHSFVVVSIKIKKALQNPNTLENFDSEIGFLKIIGD